MLEFNKRHYIISKVSKSTKNSRQLLKLVGNLLEKKDENSMPPITSNSQLVEEFVDVFLTKIENIGKSLKILSHINLDS